MEKPLVIGIVGSSASGKTTLANHLASMLDAYSPAILSMDNYYKPFSQQKKDTNGEINFDLPEAIYQNHILEDLRKLKNGGNVTFQRYTYNNPQLKEKTCIIYPSRLILIEGVFILHYSAIRSQLDFSVFMDVDAEIQVERRIIRDMQERNMQEQAIRYQWDHHVVPCFQTYVLPYKENVDYIFRNNGNIKNECETLVQTICTRFHLEI